MIKTKLIYALAERQEGTTTYKITPIDEVINAFMIENNINEDKLIDIKFSSIGYFQESGEGEIENSALIVYKD